MSNKKTKITKIILSASIITVNQLVRSSCLLNLYELIKLQTYQNIIEWVIVEGSKIKEDAEKKSIASQKARGFGYNI
jgi:hypothetical protein